MLNDRYNLTGMAVCPHTKYGQSIVILYAAHFEPSDGAIQELARRAKY